MKYLALKKITDNIRKSMQEIGISQYELAYNMGISQVTLCQILNCKQEPRISTLANIAASLDKEVTDFFEGISTKEMLE